MTKHETDLGQDARDTATSDLPDAPGPLHAGRRGLMQSIGMAGAVLSAGLLPGASGAKAAVRPAKPTNSDIALLRFVAWAELVEADLWQQYAELGGLNTGTPNPYQAALDRLDGDSGQYITSNTH